MKNTLLALGIVGLGSLVAAPAFAQTIASGSSTIVLMNGASQSVGAELQISEGLTFDGATAGTGNLLVTPTLAVPAVAATPATGLGINQQAIATLDVNAGLPTAAVTSLAPTSFTAAAAAALTAAAGDLQAQVSIIRAGAGVDGLE